jgi:hypothetical protein
MADLVMVFVAVGIIGAILNLLVGYLKQWEILSVLTLAAVFPVIGVVLLDAIYGNMGFFGAIIAFSSISVILLLTVGTLTVMAVQAFLGVEEKEEVSG